VLQWSIKPLKSYWVGRTTLWSIAGRSAFYCIFSWLAQSVYSDHIFECDAHGLMPQNPVVGDDDQGTVRSQILNGNPILSHIAPPEAKDLIRKVRPRGHNNGSPEQFLVPGTESYSSIDDRPD
jgi:hypothetical protein